MPLPHFLMLIAVVVLAAAVTLVLAVAAGVPLPVLALGVAVAALVAHLASPAHDGRDRDIGSDPHHTPGA